MRLGPWETEGLLLLKKDINLVKFSLEGSNVYLGKVLENTVVNALEFDFEDGSIRFIKEHKANSFIYECPSFLKSLFFDLIPRREEEWAEFISANNFTLDDAKELYGDDTPFCEYCLVPIRPSSILEGGFVARLIDSADKLFSCNNCSSTMMISSSEGKLFQYLHKIYEDDEFDKVINEVLSSEPGENLFRLNVEEMLQSLIDSPHPRHVKKRFFEVLYEHSF